jgi:hypothetical protein
MLDDEKLSDMIACFLHCDKPELVEYLQDLIMILQDYGEDKESYDDEMSSSEGEEIEDFEVVQDENGFFSLK